MDLTKKIDIVKNISSADFDKNYFDSQTPVIIKGLTDNTRAKESWSINYFKDSMGDFLIDIYDNNNKKSSASAFTSADLKMKFSDFLDILSKDEHTDLRVFLCNLFKQNPQLKKDFPCPEIFKGFLDGVGYMFFGGKDTTVRIHYDIDMSNVLHTHFGGRKRVVLIAPEYSSFLYRLPLNTYSLIDIDKPDYTKYPALKFVNGYDFILEDGDSVFMPGGYWHYMTYLEGSFSVSYRKISHNFKDPAVGLLNLSIRMPLDKLFNKVFGNSWLETKNNMAQRKGNVLAGKLELSV
jgi:hypothetical protein